MGRGSDVWLNTYNRNCKLSECWHLISDPCRARILLSLLIWCVRLSISYITHIREYGRLTGLSQHLLSLSMRALNILKTGRLLKSKNSYSITHLCFSSFYSLIILKNNKYFSCIQFFLLFAKNFRSIFILYLRKLEFFLWFPEYFLREVLSNYFLEFSTHPSNQRYKIKLSLNKRGCVTLKVD